MNGDRCHVCDRFPGWANDRHPGEDCRPGDSCNCHELCWGGYQCADASVEWRARAIAASVERDAALAEVARLQELLEFVTSEEDQ